ncbi:hypothetical protein [Amycolatopsis sp. NPDC051061]|uniref:hypothetical protein n=1 Tax=Amycolatopsis sp. NPDC051061 TaxID=3155042 RepID=UPI003412F1FA
MTSILPVVGATAGIVAISKAIYDFRTRVRRTVIFAIVRTSKLGDPIGLAVKLVASVDIFNVQAVTDWVLSRGGVASGINDADSLSPGDTIDIFVPHSPRSAIAPIYEEVVSDYDDLIVKVIYSKHVSSHHKETTIIRPGLTFMGVN